MCVSIRARVCVCLCDVEQIHSKKFLCVSSWTLNVWLQLDCHQIVFEVMITHQPPAEVLPGCECVWDTVMKIRQKWGLAWWIYQIWKVILSNNVCCLAKTPHISIIISISLICRKNVSWRGNKHLVLKTYFRKIQEHTL